MIIGWNRSYGTKTKTEVRTEIRLKGRNEAFGVRGVNWKVEGYDTSEEYIPARGYQDPTYSQSSD